MFLDCKCSQHCKEVGIARVIVSSSAAVAECMIECMKESSAGDLLSPYAESKMEKNYRLQNFVMKEWNRSHLGSSMCMGQGRIRMVPTLL